MRIIKVKIKRLLKRMIKKMYHWVMETGAQPAGRGGNKSEKKDIYINDIKYNLAIHPYLDNETKRIMVCQMFYWKVGYYPNIDNPKTFSEKVLWLKLYYEDPRITVCSDKYKGKEYIDKVLGQGYTVPIIKKYENVYDVDFNELPEKFVLKVNWCTGYNIIVTDKSVVDINEVRAKLDYWKLPWKSSYYGSFNWGYKEMTPVIFAEEYLDIPKNTTEYKLFCFNGVVNFTLVEMDYFGKNPMRAFYDRSWKESPFQLERIKRVTGIKRPDTYDEMLKIAEKLAEPFPYVRVDFYDICGKIYVGELTFYSGGGFTRIIPTEWDEILGKQLDITDAMKTMKDRCIYENKKEN